MVKGAQVRQKSQRPLQRFRVRPFEPAERGDVAHSAGFERQHDLREIQAPDFG